MIKEIYIIFRLLEDYGPKSSVIVYQKNLEQYIINHISFLAKSRSTYSHRSTLRFSPEL